jgi:aspartate dehydrogenase
MLKIGIIGCGAIGTEICRAIDKGIIDAELVAIYDRSIENCETLISSLMEKPAILSLDELIERADIVVECASQSAVREIGLAVLEKGKDLMVLSIGAFLQPGLLDIFKKNAKENNCRIYLPSGAIAGLDGLNSASIAAISKVMLSTTKNPAGLKGAPFIVENNIDLDSFRERNMLFEGSPQDAVRAFPANVNVAASVTLAAAGAKDIKIRVFVDPKATRNIHELIVEGAFGKFTTKVENVPSPDNPRTSHLAALSAIATLKKITDPVQIGT